MLNHFIPILLLSLVFIKILSAQDTPLSSRIANYDMQVFLDTEQRMTYNHTDLLWRNTSADTIYELQFHLYYNAFKNDQSTFMQEAGNDWTSEQMISECEWGWTEITRIEDQQGKDLTASMEYIQPDDGNTADQTVLRVPLHTPVLPFDSLRLQFDWQAKIPKLRIRTGYNQDYYFMAQWFPKLGVYEGAGVRCSEKGQWNCHQYHRYTEYYADFGNYRVTLDVPQDYVVGASGQRIVEKQEDNRAIYTYLAKDVIDFTWTAYPHFVEKNDTWKGVAIRLLHHPDRDCVAERYMDAAHKSFGYLDTVLGAYPYPTLTIVDPPYHGVRSSGMEYPTLITGAGLTCLPYGIRTTETITAHEMIHQYFMQMVATNEQEEAWLDEGLTSYFEARIIDHYYDYIMESDWLGVYISNEAWRRYRYVHTKNLQLYPPAQPGWDFIEGGYSPMVYGKTAVALHTLEGLVGRKAMDDIMRTYFEKWRFKHPCGQDFVDVVSAVTHKHHSDRFGASMDWFFEQTVYSTAICDYKLASIKNEKIQTPLGYVDDFEHCKNKAIESDMFRSTVSIHRMGDMQLPVELQVTYEDGSTQTTWWDGKARSKVFVFENTMKIKSAHIDPLQKNTLDINVINNSLLLEPNTRGLWKYTTAWMRWLQNGMQSLSFLI